MIQNACLVIHANMNQRLHRVNASHQYLSRGIEPLLVCKKNSLKEVECS